MNDIDQLIEDEFNSANILLVDDEPANIGLLEQILSRQGYGNVISTVDSRQVLELYQQHDVDLILLDLNMPHYTGYEVMEQLEEALDDPPLILVLTADHMEYSCQRSLEGGARDYVTKPFIVSELLSRVRNLLEGRLSQKILREQNKLLDQRVQERTHELLVAHKKINESRLQIIRHLGRVAEYRDYATGLHIIRMSKIATIVGKAAGMTDLDCDLLLHASPMHDIGKIGIPDKILLKAGKLDADEWKIMQTHAQIGADILSGDESDLMKLAREIALNHHEKWDGSGYPNGLSGDAIPLAGRITALADVYDALVNERPYKHAWPVEDAIAYIKEQSGKHFDPTLVAHFVTLLPEIIAISNAYAEPDEKLKSA